MIDLIALILSVSIIATFIRLSIHLTTLYEKHDDEIK